ncbi:TetR/AcrR family transcriptional regulator [Vibrio sp.]|uniref:TetR/AcrR family transcriptional regulator n=1 Tax=Vibrio viridaestus TaxID=2487322 RepID=A0A3N9TFQ0_9VIBR|nr:TetR/AcrR family transcriptional regulator [Vibrio viridaestus]MDC0610778.1 TetR/AcrR family transcriptional regulator [Vibrio sp.]RQW62563.1 TetR/AcrR family transcriptional regulator [Vibrio viridaestus]
MRVKTEERRQSIVEIAKEAFIQQGFEQTSMSYIAKKVGGSKATLYNYFSSKEEIFSAVMESSVTHDVADAFQKLSTSKELQVALFDFGYHYLESVLSPGLGAIRKMAISESGRSDVSRYFYENGPGKGRAYAAQYLKKQMEAGELIEADPILAASQLVALLDAELLTPVELNVIEKPSKQKIEQVAQTAINSFLKLYKKV